MTNGLDEELVMSSSISKKRSEVFFWRVSRLLARKRHARVI